MLRPCRSANATASCEDTRLQPYHLPPLLHKAPNRAAGHEPMLMIHWMMQLWQKRGEMPAKQRGRRRPETSRTECVAMFCPSRVRAGSMIPLCERVSPTRPRSERETPPDTCNSTQESPSWCAPVDAIHRLCSHDREYIHL